MPNPTPPYPMPDHVPEDPKALQQDNRDVWLNTTQRLSGTHGGNPAIHEEPYLEYPDGHDMILPS